MLVCMLTAVCLLLTTVRANLSGTTVHSGDCVCVSGTGVRARDRAGLHGTSVVGTYNTGTCFKIYGGILTTDGFKWYEVSNGGNRMWIAGNFLTKGTSSQCAAGSCSAEQKRLACELAGSANVQAAHVHPSGVHDGAYANNNLHDMCNGLKAQRSHYTCAECRSPGAPGGTTCLSLNLLKFLQDLKNHGRVIINELSGACHGCSSRHYSGLAVDLHNDARSSEYMTKCKTHGGLPLDEGNHIHCQFYDGAHPNW
ncbi:uncharacterized protein [Littorina saxatilis]|uniref:SH3b domain-containing protein n=1 Tax=Littorina saxatilis TaxID=31220 RepID=A0AAN9BC12_9CAEN